MPVLDIERIIKDYYETIKDEYPTIDLEKLTIMSKSAFWYFNKSMARDDLPTVHIKYLGEFIVLPDMVKKLLRNNNSDLKYKSITPEKHAEVKERLEKLLKDVLNENNQDFEWIITEESET